MDLKTIVEHLNAPPFNLNLSFDVFDEKTPFELLETFNDVLKYLDPRQHTVDLRDEPPETMAIRFCNFLQVLNFKSSYDPNFQQNLIHGDKRTIYPILAYILPRLPELQKRAYLARFLVPIDVPSDLAMDEEMQNAIKQHEKLQFEFKVTHANLDALKGESLLPGDLKKAIQQLDQEKDQLNNKIANLKTKHANKESFNELREVTSTYRQEQEQEVRIAERVREQKRALEQLEQHLLMATQRLHEVKRANSSDVSADRMLAVLREEVRKGRDQQERILREIEDKNKRFEQLETALTEAPVSAAEVEDLNDEVKRLTREVGVLQDKANEANNPTDDRLAVYKQQASLVAKKKERLMENIKDLEREKADMETVIAGKEKEYETVKGPNFLKGAEFKNYANSLRGKTNQFKKMKAELGEIRAELTVLNRTEQLLKSRATNMDEFLKSMEDRKGVSGYTKTQSALEDVSATKTQVDEMKGKTLEEYSRVVEKINSQLKEKKNKLAPQIKELRVVRQRYAEVEQVFLERRSVYENTLVGLDSEKAKLETDISAYQEEIGREESRYHQLQSMTSIIDAQLQRAQDEAKFLNGDKTLSREFRSYTDLYQSKTAQQENYAKELRKQQKNIKEGHEGNVKQYKLFSDMKKLLSVKMKILRQEVNAAAAQGFAQPMEADRLVL
eukprot:GILJ01002400.1.p1 GENE.GILJ01002400.1~~GILJ01002400.1.p1  ORF type:complete len:696 (-),score=172.60 GILJ01002400.1:159-2177(-)